MSCVIVLTPVVIASWPAIAGAIVAAAAAMGFERLEGVKVIAAKNRADLSLDHVEAVAGSLGRGESVTVRRGDVTVTFRCDARGRLEVHADGALPKAELQQIGKELGEAVIQGYVHRRLSEELAAQGFVTIAEDRSEDRTIRMRVRRYEG